MRVVWQLLCLLVISTAVLAQATSLTQENFKDTAKDFWFVKLYAPWWYVYLYLLIDHYSGHCKSLAPMWDKLAERLEGTKVKVGKIDCDENSALCSSYGIQGYPTLLLMKGLIILNQILISIFRWCSSCII
jgi:protein disulfide-isomerase A1